MCKRSNNLALQIMIQVMTVLTSNLVIENRCSLLIEELAEIYLTLTPKGWLKAEKVIELVV